MILVDRDRIRGGVGVLPFLVDWGMWEWRNAYEEEPGCLPHQDVGQQQLRRRAAEIFHDKFSLLWPLINDVAWVPFFFLLKKNMLVLSCCIFQSSMTMVSGLAVCVYIYVCVCLCERERESMRVCLPDPTPHDLFLYNMNVELQSVYSDLCSVSSNS